MSDVIEAEVPFEPYEYCWCGHLREGHMADRNLSVEGPHPAFLLKCFGLMPPNDADPECKCQTFVPVEVATFRMADMIMKHVSDFKMLVAVALKADDEARVVRPPGGRVH